MQNDYRIYQTADRVEMYIIQDFIQGVDYELSETPESDQAEDYGEPDREKRWFIIAASDGQPIGQLGLSYGCCGTKLIVADEPYSEQRGRDFDTEAFTRFVNLLLASFPADWRVEPISPDPLTRIPIHRRTSKRMRTPVQIQDCSRVLLCIC